MLFDQTFSSVTSAQEFFTDNVLDLGSLIFRAGGGLDLTFNYCLVGANEAGGSFNFVVGSDNVNVPLPSALLLLGAGLGRLAISGTEVEKEIAWLSRRQRKQG